MKKTSKLNIPGLIILIVLGLATFVAFYFSKELFSSESLFYSGSPNYVFAGKDVNVIVEAIVQKIPAIIRSIIIVVYTIILIKLVKVISKNGFKKSKRALTISSIIASLIKWVLGIIAIFLVLSSFGVDTTTLLASAGLLTLVIGLGAQSIVADVLAGFFLVFEGEYDVGDIVSIDGWRGTVLDIGIRVTRLIDAGGNIKTINNSDVKNVVNQTTQLSVAKVTLPIDYAESVERVELVLKNSFEEIAKKIPDIKEGPFYKGVSELGESSVNLLVVAKCDEDQIYQVQRDLTRELYLVFNKNNISVPFNQIVVSQREEEDTKVSKKVEKEAEEFVNEQKELTKDISENTNENK